MSAAWPSATSCLSLLASAVSKQLQAAGIDPQPVLQVPQRLLCDVSDEQHGANALDQLDQLLSGAAQPEHGLPEESLDRLCNHVGIVAPSNVGKTTLIGYMAFWGLPTAEVYSQQGAGRLPAPGRLEAVRLARRTCAECDSKHSLDKIYCHTKPAAYIHSKDEDIQWITKEVERVRGYKLQQSEFHALAVLGPPGNCGSVGSVVPLAVTFGCEPQALAQMFTLDQLSEPLLDHLRVVSGSCTDLSLTYREHIERQWELLTVPGSSAEEHARHMAETEAAGVNDSYQLPLKPWVRLLAGQQLVFRGRTPGEAPHLNAELLFISEVMHLLQPPALDGAGVLFSEQRMELLSMLGAQNACGPWGELHRVQAEGGDGVIDAVRDAREALLSCTQQITVFIPNELLGKLHLVFLDTVGFDDGNPTRRVRQRKIEERLQHMVLLLPRAMASMQPVMQHLLRSPFMQRLVSAHTAPAAQAGPKPKLSAVLYMERNGLEPPRGSHIGNTVALQYMYFHFKHVDDTLKAVVASSRRDLAKLLSSHMAASDDGANDGGRLDRKQELDPVAEAIVKEVNVFYSFPLLGLSVLKAQESGRGSEVLSFISQDIKVFAAKDTTEAVIEACRLRPFMDLLAAPVEEQCRGLLEEALDVVAAARVQPPRTSKLGSLKECEWTQRLAADAALLKSLASSSSKGAYCPQKREVLDRQVGPSSEFARSLHSQLETTLWTAFEKQVVGELGKQVKPILSQALARVCNRLVKKFCVRGGPPQLRSALQPAYEWRHDDAPLRTWLRAELSKHVDLSFVLKLLMTDLLPKVESETLTVMSDTILQFSVGSHASTGITAAMVKELLDVCLNFSKDLQQRFRLAFDKRNSAVRQYGRLVQERLVDAFCNRAHRTSLHSAVQQTLLVAERRAAPDMLKSVLTAWFDKRAGDLLGTLTTQLVHTDLNAQWRDFLRRLYVGAYTETHSIRQTTPRSSSLLVPVYRAFGREVAKQLRRLQDDEEDEEDGAGVLSAADKYALQNDLLALPLKVLDSCSPAMAWLLRAPMQRVSQQAAKSAVQRAVAAKPSYPLQALGNGRQASQSWASRGPEASVQQVQAFWTQLSAHGLVSADVPGVDNNCAYRAVGHQVSGLSLEHRDTQAADAAKLLREMVHDFLLHMTREELRANQAAALSGPAQATRAPPQWVAAIQALHGPTTQGLAGGGDAVASHLAAVSGGGQTTHVELCALASVLDLDGNNVALLMYSPLYAPTKGYCTTLTGTTVDQARQVVRVAWVPAAGGGGELNHFVVLKPRDDGGGGDGGRAQKKLRCE